MQDSLLPGLEGIWGFPLFLWFVCQADEVQCSAQAGSLGCLDFIQHQFKISRSFILFPFVFPVENSLTRGTLLFSTGLAGVS